MPCHAMATPTPVLSRALGWRCAAAAEREADRQMETSIHSVAGEQQRKKIGLSGPHLLVLLVFAYKHTHMYIYAQRVRERQWREAAFAAIGAITCIVWKRVWAGNGCNQLCTVIRQAGNSRPGTAPAPSKTSDHDATRTRGRPPPPNQTRNHRGTRTGSRSCAI